jgi:hypothetical protein
MAQHVKHKANLIEVWFSHMCLMMSYDAFICGQGPSKLGSYFNKRKHNQVAYLDCRSYDFFGI